MPSIARHVNKIASRIAEVKKDFHLESLKIHLISY